MNDRVLGGIGLVVAVFYIWQASLTELSFITDPLGPKAFPMLVGIVLAAASLALVIMPDEKPQWPELARLLEIGVATAVMAAYIWLLPLAGFVIATIFAAAFLSWRMGATPLAAGIAGLFISIGIYTVFHLVLQLSLARGPLGF